MSGKKCSRYQLQEELRAEVARASAVKEQARQRLELEALKLLRKEQLNRARLVVVENCHAAQRKFTAALNADFSSCVDDTKVQEISGQFAAVAQAAVAAAGEAELATVRQQLSRDEERSWALIAVARETHLRKRKAEAAAVISAAVAVRDAISDVESSKFDVAGRRKVESMLTAARAALQQRDAGEALQLAHETMSAVREHDLRVRDESVKHADAVRHCDAVVAEMAERLRLKQTDAVILRWRSDELDVVLARSTLIHGQADREEFLNVTKAVQEMSQQIDAMTTAANSDQARDDERNAVIKALAEAATELHLRVVKTKLAVPTDPRSSAIVLLEKATGEEVEVSLEHGGAVNYRIEGFRHTRVATTSGTMEARCDEASAKLVELHRELGRRGVTAGPVTWPDQPRDQTKTEKPLPTYDENTQSRGE